MIFDHCDEEVVTGDDEERTSVEGTDHTAPADPRCATPSVRFNPALTVAIIPSIEQMEEDGLVANVWYTYEELDQLKNNIRRDVISMRRAQQQQQQQQQMPVPHGEFCSRGIEHLASGAVLRERESAKNRLISSVLNEQHRQRVGSGCAVSGSGPGGVVDPNSIAAVSESRSFASRSRASSLGASDGAFAAAEEAMMTTCSSTTSSNNDDNNNCLRPTNGGSLKRSAPQQEAASLTALSSAMSGVYAEMLNNRRRKLDYLSEALHQHFSHSRRSASSTAPTIAAAAERIPAAASL